jgi:hypothetical protein
MKKMPWIEIIILLGHDEFEYAREAISVGREYGVDLAGRLYIAALVEIIAAAEQDDRRHASRRGLVTSGLERYD